jgi:hypothetical protein
MIKYELLDILDDLSSIERMVVLHSSDPDNISQFMVRQYRDIRKKIINEFNTITNGKKISNNTKN